MANPQIVVHVFECYLFGLEIVIYCSYYTIQYEEKKCTAIWLDCQIWVFSEHMRFGCSTWPFVNDCTQTYSSLLMHTAWFRCCDLQLMSFASNKWMVYAGRFITGVAMSITSLVVPVRCYCCAVRRFSSWSRLYTRNMFQRAFINLSLFCNLMGYLHLQFCSLLYPTEVAWWHRRKAVQNTCSQDQTSFSQWSSIVVYWFWNIAQCWKYY